ncbi:unnamed protein product [marine sediment metagenome]|uniref:Uncharacterized protein n=1 Tax=marine sediment metagenome TaxID=412755 RepID=X1JV91_9ZZZZ
MTEEKKSVKLPSAPTIEKLKEVKFATEIRAAPAPKKGKGK